MKRVGWYAAKVWKQNIDIWTNSMSRREAEAWIKKDEDDPDNHGEPSPFSLVKLTYETVVPSYKVKRKKS